MWAIKIGTTERRIVKDASEITKGEVEFDGDIAPPFLPDVDSMMWDEKSQNIIPVTDQLPYFKTWKLGLIREKTKSIFSNAGLSFDSLTFSLSQLDRMQYTVNFLAAQNGAVIYPLRISAIDGTEYDLADINAVSSFYKTMITATQNYYDGERSLLKQVAAAQTVEDVQAIKDDR